VKVVQMRSQYFKGVRESSNNGGCITKFVESGICEIYARDPKFHSAKASGTFDGPALKLLNCGALALFPGRMMSQSCSSWHPISDEAPISPCLSGLISLQSVVFANMSTIK
jgi:hypothetical protein